MRIQRYLLAAAFLLPACASAPKVDYYTVSMEPSGRARPTVDLKVERLQTTDALSRSQILIATSPTTLDYYATDLWAAGVGEMVQLKLQTELGAPVDGRTRFLLSGTVLAFQQVDTPGGADALARLEIEVRDLRICLRATAQSSAASTDCMVSRSRIQNSSGRPKKATCFSRKM